MKDPRLMKPDNILEILDAATEPCVMPKDAAVEYLEEVRAGIDSRLEVIREEIANEPTP